MGVEMQSDQLFKRLFLPKYLHLCVNLLEGSIQLYMYVFLKKIFLKDALVQNNQFIEKYLLQKCNKIVKNGKTYICSKS